MTLQLSHQEDGVARIETAHTGTGNERFSLVRRKVAEQGTMAEQPASVFQIGSLAA
jgi:hypothetical protein